MQLPSRGNGSPRLTAVLLIGHGSARYPDAGVVLMAHAHALRDAIDEVAVGLLAGSPSVEAARAELRGPLVHVVPFFMEDGFFTRVAVPRALNPEQPDGLNARSWILHPPIGLHPAIPALIAARAPAGMALLLVGHGSARAPGRRMAAHGHADALRACNRFPIVETAFLEEAPFVPDVLARLGDRPVAVMGLFTSLGTHARDDLPALLDVPNRRHQPVRLGIIGDDSGLPPLIARLIGETLTGAEK